MSMVHLSAGINPPASPHLLSEPVIVARLAHATLAGRTRIDWLWLAEDYSRIRDEIAKVFDDFADFNARVAKPGGFRLYNGASERVWKTRSGKADFKLCAIARDTPIHKARARVRDSIVFTLQTTRSHDQYNTTIHGHDDRYRGVFGQRRVLFINREDIRALGFRDGDCVDLATVWDDGQDRRANRFRLVAYDIPRGNVAAYYPETNPLVPLSSVALNAGTPTSKSIPVVLLPHRADECSAAILRVLRAAPPPGSTSLPRLAKKLGLSASALLRQLTLMGDAEIGGRAGPGWVRVVQDEERWIVHLTDAGRRTAEGLPPPDPPDVV